MKYSKLSYIAAALAAMTAVSCSNENEEQTSNANSTKLVPMTFTATQEESDVTRTYIDGTKVKWQSDDVIGIFDGTNEVISGETYYTPRAFALASGAETTYATFTGEVESGSDSYIAIYPYNADIFPDDYPNATAIYGVTIPEEQTATIGSYDPTAAVMTAVATNTNFAFKNVCAFLQITTDKAYQKIIVSTTDGSLAGYGYVSVEDADNPAFTAYAEQQTITLKPASGTMAAGTYYIAVTPGTIKGITVSCIGATSYCERKTTSSFTLERSKSYSLGQTSGWASFDLTEGAFSVSASKKVEFSSGNLYWDGDSYELEDTQIAHSTTWNTAHVGHFYWVATGDTKNKPYDDTPNFTGIDLLETDKLWCGEDNPLTISGTDYYALTLDEWQYLLGKNTAHPTNPVGRTHGC